MLIVTINEIPGKKLEALGVVRGSTVQSRNLGHDMMAGFRTLVGGEVTDYAEMLTEARQIATGRMASSCNILDMIRFSSFVSSNPKVSTRLSAISKNPFSFSKSKNASR